MPRPGLPARSSISFIFALPVEVKLSSNALVGTVLFSSAVVVCGLFFHQVPFGVEVLVSYTYMYRHDDAW